MFAVVEDLSGTLSVNKAAEMYGVLRKDCDSRGDGSDRSDDDSPSNSGNRR